MQFQKVFCDLCSAAGLPESRASQEMRKVIYLYIPLSLGCILLGCCGRNFPLVWRQLFFLRLGKNLMWGTHSRTPAQAVVLRLSQGIYSCPEGRKPRQALPLLSLPSLG
jgi:hypothetical protein